MRRFLLGLLAGCTAASAPGQPAPLAADRLFVSSASLEKMIEEARTSLKPGQAITGTRILQSSALATLLEYRVGVGNASVHERDAELFVVIDGSGTLVTGGAMQNEKRTDAANMSGTGIVGGREQVVGKGDSFVVPEKTPHWFSRIDGRLVMISVKLPRQ